MLIQKISCQKNRIFLFQVQISRTCVCSATRPRDRFMIILDIPRAFAFANILRPTRTSRCVCVCVCVRCAMRSINLRALHAPRARNIVTIAHRQAKTTGNDDCVVMSMVAWVAVCGAQRGGGTRACRAPTARVERVVVQRHIRYGDIMRLSLVSIRCPQEKRGE